MREETADLPLDPGRLSPRGTGSFGLSVVGSPLQPTVMPKWNEVLCVWMHGRHVCTPVWWAAGRPLVG